MRRIETMADVEEGARWLASADPAWARALDRTGLPPLRRRKDGFAAVLSAIVGQQISVAAADAILRRMKAARLTGPRKIAWASDEDLRACGLSQQKMRYVRALAAARIDWPALRTAPHEAVLATLTDVPGVGAWTAEMYAMFALGDPDVFAPGDLALQEGARMLFGWEDRPKERAFRDWAAAWSPWRAVAARMLWAYYAAEKRREGVR